MCLVSYGNPERGRMQNLHAALVCEETIGKCAESERAREDGIRFFATQRPILITIPRPNQHRVFWCPLNALFLENQKGCDTA